MTVDIPDSLLEDAKSVEFGLLCVWTPFTLGGRIALLTIRPFFTRLTTLPVLIPFDPHPSIRQ